jgi:hypothetical protein
VIIMENQGKGKNNNNNEDRIMNNPNQFRSIMDWWQQYSPMAWGEMYNEYITYITSMTEIYKEYIKRSEKMTELYKELAENTERMTDLYKESVKNTERMTNHWLNKFPNPPSSKEQRREKQVNKLKDKK